MGHTTTKITGPVVLQSDVNAVLGLTYDNVRSACLSSSINMWAKWKPVSKNLQTPSDDQYDFTNNSWKRDDQLLNPWWHGNDGNFGLTFTAYNINASTQIESGVEKALNDMLASIDGQANDWAYQKPTGGLAAPYRLGDFAGYNHKAPQPIKQFSCTPDVAGADLSPWYVSGEFIETDPSIPIGYRDYIMPTDIVGSTLYIGLAIYKKVGNQYQAIAWCTGNVWEGNGIKSFDVPDGITGRDENKVVTSFSGSRTYYVLPVYFTCELAQPSAGQSANPNNSLQKVIPVPFCDFDSFDTTHATTYQRIGLPVASSKNITVVNNTGSYVGIISLDSRGTYYIGGTCSVTVGVVNSSWTGSVPPSQGQYAYWQDFTNITVPDETVYQVVSLNLQNLDLSKTWKIIIIVDGSQTVIGLRQPAIPEA